MRIFTIVGIVLAVAGAFFAFVAFLTPVSDNPLDFSRESAPILALVFLPMGIVFALVGWYTARLSSNRQKLMQQGLAGQATILSVVETGVYINERPVARLEMSINLPGRAPYTVQHSEVIPLIALGMITPGSSLPVAVDPTDPQKLAIDWSGETRTRALGAAATGYPARMQPAAGMPTPNTLSTSVASAVPNTLLGSPPIGDAQPGEMAVMGGMGALGAMSGLPTSSNPGAGGTGFTMPMGMTGMPGQSMISIGGATLDLSAIYQQLAKAGVTITGGLPTQMISGTSMVVDARPGDVAQHLAELKGSGQSGRASVTGAQDMGFAIHGNQLAMLDLSVTPDGGVVYPARVTALIPPTSLGRAAVGGSLPLFIDRSNPQNLAIDWDGA